MRRTWENYCACLTSQEVGGEGGEVWDVGGMSSQNLLCSGAIPVVEGIACLWHPRLTIITPLRGHRPKIDGQEYN